MDIVNAYVNAKVDETLIVKAPLGIELMENEVLQGMKDAKLLQLLRSLYGLRQAGKNWNDMLSQFLISLGFEQSKFDPCLFLGNKNKFTNQIPMVVIYVDDILALADMKGYEKLLNAVIDKGLEVTPMGEAKFFLGIEIEKTKTHYKLSQKAMIRDILKRYAMSKADQNPLPMSKDSANEAVRGANGRPTDIHLYRSIVGSLQYLAVWTRPDIAFYVGFLSRFLVDPKEVHMVFAKRMLRYLKGTIDSCISYQIAKSDEFKVSEMKPGQPTLTAYSGSKRPGDEEPAKDKEDILTGYSDADWAEDKDTRKSTSGFIFHLDGHLISWKSKLQGIVTRSSFESEYVALVEAIAEAISTKWTYF